MADYCSRAVINGGYVFPWSLPLAISNPRPIFWEVGGTKSRSEVVPVTAYEDLLEWARTRPWWQQKVLAQLAIGEPVSDDDCAEIAAALLGDEPSPPKGGWLGSMHQPVEASVPPVRLVRIGEVEHINRLASDQTLTFGETGVTVIYGHNGSGKSGYARLIRQMVRTRHRGQVLPNIFEADAGTQRAALEYSIGDETKTAYFVGESPLDLAQVSFYDGRCGDSYVTAEAEVIYRPPALRLMDDLIAVCGRVRTQLDRLLAENAPGAQTLPGLPDETEPGQLISGLSATTTDEEIESACSVPEDAQTLIEVARDEEARLRVTDPAKEKARLARLSRQMVAVADHLDRMENILGGDAERALRDASDRARQLRAAADLASSVSFDGEPLARVGSQAWRALWDAARAYSEASAYPKRAFPVTDDGAVCVLCQQNLDEAASQRLDRFHAFVNDHTAHQAREAERDLRQLEEDVRGVQVRPADVQVALSGIEDTDSTLTQEIGSLLDARDARRAALLDANVSPPAVPDSATIKARLRDGATALDAKVRAIDTSSFAHEIARLAAKQKNLTARLALRNVKQTIIAERDRLRERASLEEAIRGTDTRGMTRTASDLTRTHVTVSVQDRFSRESQMLEVERVTLFDKRGQRGVLLHKPDFIGAAVPAELPQVLSEGEQTALGLAGYFVEADFDTTKSALVLDDPVTSLDHIRRDKVARRLVKFAKDRQVIVFTHDASFAGALRRTADALEVTLTERGVERRRSDEAPGVCVDKHPWTVRDSKNRIHDLRQDLARIRRECGAWDGDQYEREVSGFADRLSRTWERLVSQEVAGRIFDRGSMEVRITMMKIAANITSEDDKALQESYHRCSGWTRHDQDQALNYVPPKPDDLERELATLESWYSRVKTYMT